MIQEQISTSSPKCLDGNAGFGVVAQTSGMAPNVARDVSMLSGYTHHFAAGDAKNPVVFLHVLRRTGGTDRHIVSRVADCGNDYSGRTNRIAHHLIVEESDLRSLSCGPVTILSQRELFRTQWNEKSQELSRGKTIPNLPISAKKCVAWERWFGDAGWGGIFAEQAEKGDPISLIFEAGTDVLPLLAEAFALLPPNARWKTTFSTFFMKSQEPPGAGKVQVKCILAGTEAEAFARLTPNTLVLDLRKQPDTAPAGKYVVAAQTGVTAQPLPIEKPIELETPSGIERKKREAAQHVAVSDREGSGENLDLTPVPVSIPGQQGTYQPSRSGKKKKKQSYFKIIAPALLVLLIAAVVGGGIYYASLVANNAAIAKAEQERKDAETKVAAEKEEQEKKDAEVKAAAEKAEKNKKEAEAKAAAEQAEKDKKEAEAKAAAEQAEKDKKEAEAKAAAEKAEKDKKEAEAKTAAENEIKQQLADLPDFWEDRGLPLSSIYYPALGKEKTSFLWKIKDRVKLSVIPFVDLNKNVQPIQFDNDNKNQQISFWQEAEKDINGHPRKETIVTINLKEDGLNFEWNKSLITKNNDVESSRNLNRILLSKLKVEVEGIEKPKEIALFNPAKCNNNGTKYFTLWQQKGKEFVIYNTENASLLLDFTEWFNRDEKKSVPEPRNFQKAPYSLAYAPQTNTDLSCGLTLGDEKDLKFQISFVSKSLEPLLTNKKNIETQIKDLQKDKKNSKDKNTLESAKNTLNNQLNQLKQLPNIQLNKDRREELQKQMNLTQEQLNKITEIETQIKTFKEQLKKKEQEIEDEKKKWANIRIEAFSIYLLKHDTKPEEIGKQENRLLLLEVKP